MQSFILLGTDTDAGKTTLSLLWLARFGSRYAYWKPVETGPSDSATVRQLVPEATIHAPAFRLETPVAPPLAARQEGRRVPSAAELAVACPRSGPLLVESFGGPMSPLNENELQTALIEKLNLPCILVGPSTLGAVGR